MAEHGAGVSKTSVTHLKPTSKSRKKSSSHEAESDSSVRVKRKKPVSH